MPETKTRSTKYNLLDDMGDSIGLIRLVSENFERNLITKEDALKGINESLDNLFKTKEEIDKNL